MINQYPAWKYALIAVFMIFGAIYALPNLYGEDPAIQISANRMATIDATVMESVEQALKDARLEYKSVELTDGRMLVRFSGTETQLAAADRLKDTLGNSYVVALNLASAEPGWLRDMGSKPMYLGLDLRGGVHFLLEVDMETALKQREDNYVTQFRELLRKQEPPIRYQRVFSDAGKITLFLKNAQDQAAALDALEDDAPELQFSTGDTVDQFLVEAVIPEQLQREIQKFALEQNITTLRNRVNELGVAEPVIQQQGSGRIVVQLPGVQDTVQAKKILGATATLEFRMVAEKHDPFDAKQSGRIPPGTQLYQDRNERPVLLERKVIVRGDRIINAASGFDENGQPAVHITLDSQGAKQMTAGTRENVGRPMATVFIENRVDTQLVNGEQVKVKQQTQEVINIATIREELHKRFQISGLDSSEEARNLALLLRAGALAAPVEIIEERTIGPSLGAENIKQGFNSVIIGFALVLIFMAVYYRAFGLFANIALTVNLVLMIAILSMLQATLTMPGIAGIVLTVGMAVDANVLIFERIREELSIGNSPQASIHAGYEKAFSTIADANITTLIAAIVLFSFGTGPVKGFAVTLSIGIVTSMFTAIMGTRALVNYVYGGKRIKKLSI